MSTAPRLPRVVATAVAARVNAFCIRYVLSVHCVHILYYQGDSRNKELYDVYVGEKKKQDFLDNSDLV